MQEMPCTDRCIIGPGVGDAVMRLGHLGCTSSPRRRVSCSLPSVLYSPLTLQIHRSLVKYSTDTYASDRVDREFQWNRLPYPEREDFCSALTLSRPTALKEIRPDLTHPDSHPQPSHITPPARLFLFFLFAFIFFVPSPRHCLPRVFHKRGPRCVAQPQLYPLSRRSVSQPDAEDARSRS